MAEPYTNVETSDEELMTAYQNGTELAFEALYKRFSGKVYGYISSKLFERSLTDDVFQKAWLKFHQVRHQYQSKFKFRPWLFTIVHTTIVDAIREQSRNLKTIELSETLQKPSSSAFEMSGSVATALAKLPDIHRQALELRYLEELPYIQIAHELNTSQVNARKLVSRALQNLKAIFKGEKK